MSLDMLPMAPQCFNCAHYEDGRCPAFSRIPDEIWSNLDDHRTAYRGDGGLRWSPVHGATHIRDVLDTMLNMEVGHGSH